MPDVGPALCILEDSTEPRTEGRGTGGLRQWTLAADNAGVLALQLELKRSWQPDPAQTFKVVVAVKAR